MKKQILFIAVGFSTLLGFAQKPSPELLNPTNHAVVMISYEGQMVFATKSIAMDVLRSNVGLVVGASKIFQVPAVIKAVAEKIFAVRYLRKLWKLILILQLMWIELP